MSSPYYILKIYIMNNDVELTEKYSKMCAQKQKNLDEYISSNGANASNIDCGIDLFCPNDVKIKNSTLSNKVPMGIKCSMTFGGMFSGYYLYPRSSMGAKTPIRLSNSVGIIDAGYRGELGIALDNIRNKPFKIEKGWRLVQACSNDLMPFKVEFVNELNETRRGEGGFGSTGQ